MIDLDSVAFRGATFDSRAVKPGMLFVALKGGKTDGHDYIPQALAAGAAGVVDGLAELQALARERRRRLKATVIGVTGSAGKTTTKEFLKAFLACPGTAGNFNNHIGLPLTILNCPEDAAFLVLEMGTNHPGEIAALCDIAAPDVGAISSIGTAHLEFFGTQEAIAREKGTLFASARRFNVAPANVNQREVLRSLSKGELVEADGTDATLPACPLPGPHNRSDMAVAWTVARRLGVSAADCAARLAHFELPGARWRRFERRGVRFVDDSYNANPDSMVAALEAFAQEPCKGRRIAVLGDMFELGPDALALHRKVFEKARALALPLVIGVGEISSQCPCHRAFRDLAALKTCLAREAAPGDLVLLKGSHAMHLTELADF